MKYPIILSVWDLERQYQRISPVELHEVFPPQEDEEAGHQVQGFLCDYSYCDEEGD